MRHKFFLMDLQMYEEAGREVGAGFRVYIVYPIIEESTSEKMADVKAAELEFERLQVNMIHLRQSSKQKPS
jgi:RecG-like helicase